MEQRKNIIACPKCENADPRLLFQDMTQGVVNIRGQQLNVVHYHYGCDICGRVWNEMHVLLPEKK